jgi:DNA-binding MarR family transcriptional regulator
MTPARQQMIEQNLETMGTVLLSFRRGHDPEIAALGLGWPHLRLMAQMARRPEGVPVKDLADCLHVTSGAITQFIDRLVEVGLVERSQDPEDRRLARAKLSQAGTARFTNMRRLQFEKMIRLFEELDDAELVQLVGLLKKIRIEHAGQACRHASR